MYNLKKVSVLNECRFERQFLVQWNWVHSVKSVTAKIEWRPATRDDDDDAPVRGSAWWDISFSVLI